jgi:carbon monoxide dehydrogenase subunit G
MTRLNERIETALPIEEAFAYLADFANSQEWDPGVARAERIGGPGDIGVGTRFRLGVRQRARVVPMEYRITDFDRPHRVVLAGSGSGITAVDELLFQRSGNGTIVSYAADIRLGGLLRLIQPFLGGTFRRIAADAAAGIQSTLAARAAAGGTHRP